MGEMVISTDPHEAYRRAQTDALQDSCENAHFASIGGMDKRASDDLMEVPEYIAPHCHRAYLEGYKAACEEMFGEDWRTCPFGWAPVLEISGSGENTKARVIVPADNQPPAFGEHYLEPDRAPATCIGCEIEKFSLPYLRRVIACTCGFSAIQTKSGSREFECHHCGKVQTWPREGTS